MPGLFGPRAFRSRPRDRTVASSGRRETGHRAARPRKRRRRPERPERQATNERASVTPSAFGMRPSAPRHQADFITQNLVADQRPALGGWAEGRNRDRSVLIGLIGAGRTRRGGADQ